MLGKYSVTPGVLIEHVGNELIVVVPGNNDYVKLSGEAAEVLLSVKTGNSVSGSDIALANLEHLGVITATGVSRRSVIKAGAIGAGAGIAVLSMPGVAAASSISCESATFDVGVGLNSAEFDNRDDIRTVSLLISFSDAADIPGGLVTGQTATWVWEETPTAFPNGVTVTWNGDANNSDRWVFENLETGFDLAPLQPAQGPSDPDPRFLGTLTFSIGGCDYVGTSDGLIN